MTDPHRFPVGSIVLVPMLVTEHRPPGTHDRDGRPDGTPAAIELASMADPVAVVALDGDDLAHALPARALVDAIAHMAQALAAPAGGTAGALAAVFNEHGVTGPMLRALGAYTAKG